MDDVETIASPGAGEEPRAAIARIESLAQKRFTPNGAGKMLWHIWGEGTPLILLHGGFGSWLHWTRNIPFLAERFTVYAADMPGFGDSDDLPQPQTPDHVATILSSGIDRILPAGERFHLLGFSFGGIVGGLLAALSDERVLSVTFSGSNGMGLTRNPWPMLRNWWKTESEEKRLQAHRRNLEILMFADPAKIDPLAVYIQSLNAPRGRMRTDKFRPLDLLQEPLRRTKGRLMGLWGGLDAISKGHLHERAAYLEAIRSDSVFRVIEGAGHWACYEAADAFNRTYLEMLREVDA